MHNVQREHDYMHSLKSCRKDFLLELYLEKNTWKNVSELSIELVVGLIKAFVCTERALLNCLAEIKSVSKQYRMHTRERLAAIPISYLDRMISHPIEPGFNGILTKDRRSFDASEKVRPVLRSLAMRSSASTWLAISATARSARPLGRHTTPFRSPIK